MKLCFLIEALPAPPVIAGYATRLGADLVVTERRPPGRVAGAIPVDEAKAGGPYDVAVAADWASTAHLFDVPAERRAFWVDHFAHRRMGTWEAERFAAQLAYDLPVDFIAAAPWVRDALADLRPEARTLLVTSGAPEGGSSGGPGGGSSGGPGAAGVASPSAAPLRVALAGDGDERAAFAAMAEAATEVPLAGGPDVVVMLSPVDGVLGAPLAGFRSGATAVVGPAPDAGDLVRHGENGLIADADDVRGAARWLDHLARDRELLDKLKAGAREAGAAWPTWEQAAEQMKGALEQLVTEDPPPQAAWPVRLMGDAIGGAAVFRQEHQLLSNEVRRHQSAPPTLAVRARTKLGALRRRMSSRG